MAAIVSSLSAMACDADRPTGPSSLAGAWRLVAIEQGSATRAVDDPDRYTIAFDGARTSLRADCNSCSGSYAASGPSIRFGPIACTRAYCGAASLDTLYLVLVDAADRHSVRDGQLRLESPAGVLRFRR